MISQQKEEAPPPKPMAKPAFGPDPNIDFKQGSEPPTIQRIVQDLKELVVEVPAKESPPPSVNISSNENNSGDSIPFAALHQFVKEKEMEREEKEKKEAFMLEEGGSVTSFEEEPSSPICDDEKHED